MFSPSVNGITYKIYNPDDVIQGVLLSGAQWNTEIIDIIKTYISTHNLQHFLNVGTHIGSVSLPVSRHINKVSSIEAYPPSYSHLCENITLNNISNITTYNIAVGNDDAPVYFLGEDMICPVEHCNRVKNNTGGMHALTEKDIAQGMRSAILTDRKIVGQMTTLNKMDIDNFDIMLVDIEGCEYEFLLGAKEKIIKNKPIIIIEIWDNDKRARENMKITAEETRDFILSLGYKLVRQIGDDYIFESL
jgi:FkbM family methyltransferase